jgi:hypothetical protein
MTSGRKKPAGFPAGLCIVEEMRDDFEHLDSRKPLTLM